MKEHGGEEERDIEEEVAEAASAPSTSAADALVLGSAETSHTPEVAAYLAAQTRLLGVQFEHMHQQRVLQLEHLRVRRWRERLQLLLQALLWLLAGAIIAGIAALALWAMRDESMVIRALKAPPPLAAEGLDGAVLATKLLDDVKALQSQADSARAPNTMKGAGEEDIKVEIPETGISVGELLKYLRAWLGHETQVTGEVYLEGPDVVVTVRAGEEAGRSFRGPRSDLDRLMNAASEAVFAETQPYLYAVYLFEHARQDESLKVTRALATGGPARERGWAYAHWSHILLARGDDAGAAERARQGLALDPALVTAESNLAAAEQRLGHNGAAYAAARRALDLLRPGRPANVTPAAADQFRSSFSRFVAEATGDYGGAAALSLQQMELPDYEGNVAEASVSIADDLAENHDVAGSRAALARAGFADDGAVLRSLAASGVEILPFSDLYEALGDWKAALAGLQSVSAWTAVHDPGAANYLRRTLQPMIASALAEDGRRGEADAIIAATPMDCMACLIARGRIAALEGRGAEADRWFGRAVEQGRALPKPFVAWGEALLARGDPAGAARRADDALKVGPRYADAHLLLAEARLRQGAAEAAVSAAKDAARLAPRWGRLHLVWGEALARLGRKPEALSHYRQAAPLGLSPTDQVRLARDLRAS